MQGSLHDAHTLTIIPCIVDSKQHNKLGTMTNPSIPNGTPSAIPSLDAKGVTTAGPWGPHGELGPLPPHLAAKAASIRAARDATIPSDLHFDPSTIPPIPALAYKTSGHLSSRQIGIVELCASDLAQAVAEGEYTAVEVTEAYIVAAALAHAGTNCLIWMDVDGARERAKELDEYRERTGGTVGPLHGVVLSVKGESGLNRAGWIGWRYNVG